MNYTAPPQTLRPTPTGLVLIGKVSELTQLAESDVDNHGYMTTHPSGGWVRAVGLSSLPIEFWIAGPIDSNLAASNPDSVIACHPARLEEDMRGAPDDLPDLPEGFVWVGYGDILRNETNPREEGFLCSDGELSDLTYPMTFPDSNRFFAYPADGQMARSFHRRVSFYNESEQEPTVLAPNGPRQWMLTLNGAPLASKEDLKDAVKEMVLVDANLDPMTNLIWTALEYDNPESMVAEWVDVEPVVLSCIDFHPVSNQMGISIPTIAESEKSISDIIIASTAGVLLRGGLSNHFRYLENGELVVNPENPPSLDQGYEIIHRTLEIKNTSQKLDNYSAWTLGMLGDQLERLFGSDFDPSVVMQATSKAYNTYITSLGVFRAYWANKRPLSYTHHKEAFYAKIEPEQKDWVLDASVKMKLSVSQQRKLTSYVRVYGNEEIDITDEDLNSERLMEKIEVRSVNKNYLFRLRDQWYRYRGPFENIPNGAGPILNADTRALISTTGTAYPLNVWEPVGIQTPYVRGHAAATDANREAALEADAEVVHAGGGNTTGTIPNDVGVGTTTDMRHALADATDTLGAALDEMALDSEEII